MVEHIIEVDKDDNQIGVRPRTDFFKSARIHRAAHLILFNSKGQILLQLRSDMKKVWPSLFTYSVDCTVGNETYEECIDRETREEIGISVEAKRLFTFPHFEEIDKAWHCVFVGRSDERIRPDAREIQEIRWIDADELQSDIVKNPEKYVPPFIKGMNQFFSDYYETDEYFHAI